MARSRFVHGETVRLPLSGGDYIDVKKELSAGEREDLFGVIAPTMTAGEKVLMNTRSVRTAKILAYLLAWSFVGPDDTPIPMSPDLPEAVRLGAIRNLRTPDFDELFGAIIAHEGEQEDARVVEKNDPDGAIGSVKISPSVN